MKLSTVKKLYFAALVGILLLAMIGRSWPTTVFYTAVFGAVAAYVVMLYKFWRCPVCGKSLGKMTTGKVVVCPHCQREIKL